MDVMGEVIDTHFRMTSQWEIASSRCTDLPTPLFRRGVGDFTALVAPQPLKLSDMIHKMGFVKDPGWWIVAYM